MSPPKGQVFGTEWRDRATGFERTKIDALEARILVLKAEIQRLRVERHSYVDKIYHRNRYPRRYQRKTSTPCSSPSFP